jgi:hypothetical protein
VSVPRPQLSFGSTDKQHCLSCHSLLYHYSAHKIEIKPQTSHGNVTRTSTWNRGRRRGCRGLEDAAAGQGGPGPGAGPLRAGDRVQLPPAPTLPDPPPSRHHRHRLREPQQARMVQVRNQQFERGIRPASFSIFLSQLIRLLTTWFCFVCVQASRDETGLALSVISSNISASTTLASRWARSSGPGSAAPPRCS